jgi:fatty-acyl-CoA synthase
MAPVVPMFHAMCWGTPFAALTTGARFCCNGRFMSPDDTLSICSDWGVTFSAAVPTVWQSARATIEKSPAAFKGKIKLERYCEY